MSNGDTSAVQSADVPSARVAPNRSISIVWIVPLIAAAIGAVLAYEAWFASGPRITIRFEEASGLTPKQTPVRYHGVECGVVDSISLSDDVSHVVVQVTLQKGAAMLAREGTKFWIVRPEVSVLGVRSLETLVSGPFIQAVPGSGAPADTFAGLRDPPPPGTLEPGIEIVLQSDRRGALRVGSPVYYREVEVGKVTSYRLGKDSQSVEITTFIDAAHASLVRTTSRFWNVSGLQINIGMEGAKLDLESIESLLAGGVEFDTPQAGGAPAQSGAIFRLHDKAPEETAAPSTRRLGLRVTLIAKRLAGLGVGSPVSFRQVQVGEIEKVGLAPDARSVHIEARIDDRYRSLVRDGSKFWNASGVNVDVGLTGAKLNIESLKSALGGGIQFATPEESSAPVSEGAIFYLFEKADTAWTEWAPALTIAGSEASDTSVQGVAPPRTRSGKTRKSR